MSTPKYIFFVGEKVRTLPLHKQWGSNAGRLSIKITDPQPGQIFTIKEITPYGGYLSFEEHIREDGFDPGRFEPASESVTEKRYTVIEMQALPLSFEEAVKLAKMKTINDKHNYFVVEFPEIVGAVEQKIVIEYTPIKRIPVKH